jgi:hypothetical protein
MIEFIKILFDRKHVKDVRNWVLMILVIAFGSYHRLAIKPMQERLDKQGKRILEIIRIANLANKIENLEKNGDLSELR